jgi:hypothetical protein
LNTEIEEYDRQRNEAERDAFKARTEIGAVQSELNLTKSKRVEDQLAHAREVAELKADTTRAIKEKDALILEWMHSNEAFKKLARQYGKKLGVTDEQRQQDFDQAVVDVSVENPKYAKTEIVELKKKRLGIQK